MKMQPPHGKSRDPGEIKKGILEKSGSRVSDIPLDAALNPDREAKPDDVNSEPGDDDPSRDISSAEVGMTFNGRENGGSANLSPFIKRRLGEITERIAKQEPPAS